MKKRTPGFWYTDNGKSFYVFAHGSLMEQAGVTNGPFICNASTKANKEAIEKLSEEIPRRVNVSVEILVNNEIKKQVAERVKSILDQAATNNKEI